MPFRYLGNCTHLAGGAISRMEELAQAVSYRTIRNELGPN